MAFCGKCGAQLHENATFCAACGTPTATAGAPPVVTHSTVTAGQGEPRGLFSSLFDFSFTSFVTGRLIKVLYVLAMIVLVVGTILLVLAAQTQPSPAPIVAIIVAPIAFFLYLILVRVQLEILIVIFRMSEHLEEIAQQGRR